MISRGDEVGSGCLVCMLLHSEEFGHYWACIVGTGHLVHQNAVKEVDYFWYLQPQYEGLPEDNDISSQVFQTLYLYITTRKVGF